MARRRDRLPVSPHQTQNRLETQQGLARLGAGGEKTEGDHQRDQSTGVSECPAETGQASDAFRAAPAKAIMALLKTVAISMDSVPMAKAMRAMATRSDFPERRTRMPSNR